LRRRRTKGFFLVDAGGGDLRGDKTRSRMGRRRRRREGWCWTTYLLCLGYACVYREVAVAGGKR